MIASLIMMGLGPFRFGLTGSNYQEMIRTSGWRWAELQRQGRTPALQYAGPTAETLTLKGIIYPHFNGGLRQVDQMRAQGDLGVPLMMVDGLGFVWRRWVITDLEERKSVLMSDGAPRKIEFALSLKRYGEDFFG